MSTVVPVSSPSRKLLDQSFHLLAGFGYALESPWLVAQKRSHLANFEKRLRILCSGRWRISAICFGRLLLRWVRARSRRSEQVADRSVNELELRDKLGGDFPVAVVGQMDLMQLTLQSNDVATKGISFSDKALNCARGGE